MTDEFRRAEKRVALIIGNADYKHERRLTNPLNDAQAIAKCLENLGFSKIEHYHDLSADALKHAVRAFRRTADTADTAVVYFAGHGIEVGGVNFLLAVDAQLEDIRDVEHEAVSLDQLLNVVEGAKRLRLVILDACRDSDVRKRMVRLTRTRSVGPAGLADVDVDPGNLVVAYAAKGGTKALDGEGSHSPYAEALLEHLGKPLDIRLLFGCVRDAVREKTGGFQTPHLYECLGGAEVFLVPPATGPPEISKRDEVDVFLSYSRDDWPIARLLVHRLRTEGYTVWWDKDLTGGSDFARETLEALAAARAAIVIWTKTSVDSGWVKGEARRAFDHKIDSEGRIRKLVPLRAGDLDIRRIGPPFDALHTLSLDEHQRLKKALQKRGVHPRPGFRIAEPATADEARNILDPGEFETFLEQSPDSLNAPLAERQVETLIAEGTVSEVLERFIRDHHQSKRIPFAQSRLAALERARKPKRRGAEPTPMPARAFATDSDLHPPPPPLSKPSALAASEVTQSQSPPEPAPSVGSPRAQPLPDNRLVSQSSLPMSHPSGPESSPVAADQRSQIPARNEPTASTEAAIVPPKTSFAREDIAKLGTLASYLEPFGSPIDSAPAVGTQAPKASESNHVQNQCLIDDDTLPQDRSSPTEATSAPDNTIGSNFADNSAIPIKTGQDGSAHEQTPIGSSRTGIVYDRSIPEMIEFEARSEGEKTRQPRSVSPNPFIEETLGLGNDPQLQPITDTSLASGLSTVKQPAPEPLPKEKAPELSGLTSRDGDNASGISEPPSFPSQIPTPTSLADTATSISSPEPEILGPTSRPSPQPGKSGKYVIGAVTLASLALAASAIWLLAPNRVSCSLGGAYDSSVTIQACETAIQQDPERGELYFTLGVIHFHITNYRKAIANFDAAVMSRFSTAELFDYRGRAHEALGENNEALEDYDIAAADPKYRRVLPLTYVATLLSRGRQRLNSDKLPEAISDFGRAIDLDRNSIAAYEGRRLTYEKAGNFDEALKDFDREITLEPTRTNIMLNPQYADAYVKRGIAHTKEPTPDYATAIDDFSAALKVDPNAPSGRQFDIHNYRRMAREDVPDFNQAADDYDIMLKLDRPKAEALRLRAGYSPVYRVRGDASLREKEFKQAIAEYTIAILANSEDVLSFFRRGNTYAELGQPDAAISDFSAVITIDPTFAAAYRTRGLVRSKKGEYEDALTDLNQAIGLFKRDFESLKARRIIYETLANYERALDDYTEAANLDSEYAEAAPLDSRYSDALRTRARSFAYLGKVHYENFLVNDQPTDLNPRIELCRERARASDQLPDLRKIGIACYELALRDYDLVLKFMPDHYMALNGRCWARGITWKSEQLRPALEDCKKAEQLQKSALNAAKNNAQLTARLNANYYSTLDSRGFVYLKMKQYDEAFLDYDSVVDYLKSSVDSGDKPARAQALYGRGLAKRRARPTGGEDDINEALTLRPNVADMFKLYGINQGDTSPSGPDQVAVINAQVLNVPVSPDRERALQPKDSFRECLSCPEMVVVPSGRFMMGSPDRESRRGSDEGPQHMVTIKRPFAVGKFAVTFEEWDACAADGGCNGYHPDDQSWGRIGKPVINVNWTDAKAYVAWLSRKTGKDYRLLSEAEREYVTLACPVSSDHG
jgi:tetratricopeptide (TPR) repeat protein